MKYLIVSDIHGSLPRLSKVLEFFDAGHYDMLITLGDLLNYGPRNGVPEGLDAMGIVEKFNERADRIVAVRGNCDSEVDQMLLSFPCMSDYVLLVVGGRRIFLTHGHKFNEDNIPPVGIDAFFYGHTHLWKLERNDRGIVICNTGSVTFPKGGNVPTFVTIEENGLIVMRDLDGNVLKSLKTDN